MRVQVEVSQDCSACLQTGACYCQMIVLCAHQPPCSFTACLHELGLSPSLCRSSFDFLKLGLQPCQSFLLPLLSLPNADSLHHRPFWCSFDYTTIVEATISGNTSHGKHPKSRPSDWHPEKRCLLIGDAKAAW